MQLEIFLYLVFAELLVPLVYLVENKAVKVLAKNKAVKMLLTKYKTVKMLCKALNG